MQMNQARYLILLRGFFIFSMSMLCILMMYRRAYASNLVISDVELASYDTSADTAVIQFDIAWDYAWRNDTNYDAVWVFIKYKTSASGDWQHATLKTSGINPSGFSTGTDAGDDNINIEILVPTDKKGCFIQPSSNTGSDDDDIVDVDSIQIVWDYGFDGVSDALAPEVYFRMYGIEMAYIPEGGFYAGDASSTAAFVQGSSDTDPWYISSEDAISVEDVSGDGYYYDGNGNS